MKARGYGLWAITILCILYNSLQFVVGVSSNDIVLEDIGQVDVESHETVDHRQEDVVAEPLYLHQDVEEEALEAEHEPETKKRNAEAERLKLLNLFKAFRSGWLE